MLSWGLRELEFNFIFFCLLILQVSINNKKYHCANGSDAKSLSRKIHLSRKIQNAELVFDVSVFVSFVGRKFEGRFLCILYRKCMT